ncbi:hypothetical protein GCM10008992_16300 [Halorubrum aquaticum]
MLAPEEDALEAGPLGGDHVGRAVADVEPAGGVERLLQVMRVRFPALEAVRPEVATADVLELGPLRPSVSSTITAGPAAVRPMKAAMTRTSGVRTFLTSS